jgi:hypothetical protein
LLFAGGPHDGGVFVLSNQMDYKWTFYLFMVPAALELSESRSGSGTVGVAGMVGIVF